MNLVLPILRTVQQGRKYKISEVTDIDQGDGAYYEYLGDRRARTSVGILLYTQYNELPN